MIKRVIVGLIAISMTSFAGDYVKLKKPPKSLDKYFPPATEQPVFLYNMYQASTSFTGMLANIKQNDWKNAEKWAKSLKEAYLKVGKMVPEWDKKLRKKEINKLVEAVRNKDMNSIKKYANAVGQSCSNCHKYYMVPVKIKYHFPSVELLSFEDPVSGNEYGIEDYMKKMTNDYKLAKVFASDGKYKNALRASQNFVERFKGLTQSCSECHTNKVVEDVYFGKETENLLKKVISSAKKKDTKGLISSLNQVGGVCYKCHNVHEIPIILKDRLEK